MVPEHICTASCTTEENASREYVVTISSERDRESVHRLQRAFYMYAAVFPYVVVIVVPLKTFPSSLDGVEWGWNDSLI